MTESNDFSDLVERVKRLESDDANDRDETEDVKTSELVCGLLKNFKDTTATVRDLEKTIDLRYRREDNAYNNHDNKTRSAVEEMSKVKTMSEMYYTRTMDFFIEILNEVSDILFCVQLHSSATKVYKRSTYSLVGKSTSWTLWVRGT